MPTSFKMCQLHSTLNKLRHRAKNSPELIIFLYTETYSLGLYISTVSMRLYYKLLEEMSMFVISLPNSSSLGASED